MQKIVDGINSKMLENLKNFNGYLKFSFIYLSKGYERKEKDVCSRVQK